ncbi:hypothetical protein [Ruminococcus sp. Marseille-P6503]|uniref:hypothetical protein n=1 Tax=Ruminococcus sp. Marseille-P6503 TaxID=2364796 RepID=UPI000F51EB4A|nr:hypothetical protein [Ruminococcus sp. Marseille-P6503]
MLIMYGWGNKLKRDVPMGVSVCGGCRSFSHHYLGRLVFRVHICYIPVFWRTKGYYVFCDNCEGGQEISKEQYRELKEIYRMFTNKKLLTDCYHYAVQISQGLELNDHNVDYVLSQLQQKYPIQHQVMIDQYRGLVSDIMRFQIQPQQA